jgi:hypothetical protein
MYFNEMWRVEPVLGAKNSPFGEMMWSCKKPTLAKHKTNEETQEQMI